jgi:hypothetical protein
MTLLEVLKIIAAIGTIATGLLSLIRPRAVFGFTGLSAPGPRGITEIRAVLGGAFIGLGAATLIFRVDPAYQTLGIMYLVIAVTRIIGMVVDKSVVRSNIISLITEIVLGVVLVL